MSDLLAARVKDFEQAIVHYQEELGGLRVGRANPQMIENIPVEAYGSKTPLKQLASISAPEARSLIVAPWDASVTKDIERSIVAANIGLNPVNEGQQLRIVIPQLTEENRRELARTLSEKMEKARIAVRQLRDDIREGIVTQEREGELTQDDKYAQLKKLDEHVKKFTDKIKELGDAKEQEIMTI